MFSITTPAISDPSPSRSATVFWILALVLLSVLLGFLVSRLTYRSDGANLHEVRQSPVAVPAKVRRTSRPSRAVGVPWLSALELSTAFHDGRIDPVWLEHNGLTVRGGIVAMNPEIFDGIHAVAILASLPAPVRLWFQKDDPAVRNLAVGHPVTAHCSLGSATLDSITLYDCHVLGKGVRLGRDIWADIEMGRPIR